MKFLGTLGEERKREKRVFKAKGGEGEWGIYTGNKGNWKMTLLGTKELLREIFSFTFSFAIMSLIFVFGHYYSLHKPKTF